MPASPAVRTPEQVRAALFGLGPRRRASFALIQPQRASASSAALRTVGDTKAAAKAGQAKNPDKAWQTEAYTFAREIPELGYLISLKANVVADCEFVPQVWIAESREWINVLDLPADQADIATPAAAIMATFTSPHPGGQSELKRRAAYQLATAGETYLLGSDDDEDPATDVLWEFVSTDELDTANMTRRRDGSTKEPVDDASFIARCWRSDAQYSDLADSEVRRVLGVCAEIVVLSQVVEAVARSRIPAGILFVADELAFSETDADEPDGGEVDDIDSFTKTLIEHLSAPITDRRSAASLVPLVVRAPGELADNALRLVDLARDFDVFLQELRQEALDRLGRGLDAPPEIISGKAGLNHWTSYNIDIDFLVKHVNPLGGLLAEFVTYAYLRPMLVAKYGMTDAQARTYRVTFDIAPVTARADSAASAERLHDKLLVSDDTARNEAGFTDADKPPDDELLQRRMWSLVTAAPAVYAKALLPKITGFEFVNPDDLGTGAAQQPAGSGPIVDGTSGQQEPPTSTAPGFAVLAARLATAADAAYMRARERAAARLVSTVASRRSRVRGTATADKIAARKGAAILPTLTGADLDACGTTVAALLDDAWTGLHRDVTAWVRQYAIDGGSDTYAAGDLAAVVAQSLCDAVNEYAHTHLLDSAPYQRHGLRVPASIVEDALAPITGADVDAPLVSV